MPQTYQALLLILLNLANPGTFLKLVNFSNMPSAIKSFKHIRNTRTENQCQEMPEFALQRVSLHHLQSWCPEDVDALWLWLARTKLPFDGRPHSHFLLPKLQWEQELPVAKGTMVSGPKTDYKLCTNISYEIQVEAIAIFLIILEAQILFSIKLKILFLFNDHIGPSCWTYSRG